MSTRGFKVTDADRKSRVGIAVKNLDELKKKTVDKFKLQLNPDEIYFQTQDGTVIENDEYFQTLHAQTLLVWVKKGEKAATDAEILYKTIREVNDEYLSAGEKVQEFFTEKMKSKVFKLAEVLRGIDSEKAKLSKKEDHSEWFEGLDTNAKTKEEYMFRKAQDRIRMYYYKTKEDLWKQPDLPQVPLQALLIDLQNRLKLNKYHGYYFDRNANNGDKHMKSICNTDGNFSCKGRWDRGVCLYSPVHAINPYTSKEERVIFSTWNLDHIKERSRAVVPAIIEALLQQNIDDAFIINDFSLNIKAIYNDLFTINNLKLVHIVCHDKGAHSTKTAGPYLI